MLYNSVKVFSIITTLSRINFHGRYFTFYTCFVTDIGVLAAYRYSANSVI